MARQTLYGDTNSTGSYRKPGKREHNPVLASLRGKLTWNNRQQRAIRNQIDALHSQLETLVAEEKALLDELRGVRT